MKGAGRQGSWDPGWLATQVTVNWIVVSLLLLTVNLESVLDTNTAVMSKAR